MGKRAKGTPKEIAKSKGPKKAKLQMTPMKRATGTPMKPSKKRMAPNKRSLAGQAVSPSSPKKTPNKRRGRPVKVDRHFEGRNPAGRSASRDYIEVCSPEKEAPPVSAKCFYPFENLELASEIEGTVKAVQKAVTGVLDDHVVRCTVPIGKMASITKELQKKLVDRKMERSKGSSPILEATLDEALAEISEGDLQMNKSVFRLELIKYILIASSQLGQLSTVTLLSIVQDLSACETNLTDYQIGNPPKLAPTLNKFYGLTENEFVSLSEQKQLTMKIEYIKEGLQYHENMEKFLEQKYRSLKTKAKGDANDLFKDWPEGKKKEEELAEAFKRNNNMGRMMKVEYERLKKQEEMDVVPYRNLFRIRALNGKIGVRNENEEANLDSNFANTPLDVIKMLLNEGSIDTGTDMDVEVVDFPGKKTKFKQLEYRHSFIPTPSIHLVHENF